MIERRIKDVLLHIIFPNKHGQLLCSFALFYKLTNASTKRRGGRTKIYRPNVAAAERKYIDQTSRRPNENTSTKRRGGRTKIYRPNVAAAERLALLLCTR
jgi:hypothetical protein